MFVVVELREGEASYRTSGGELLLELTSVDLDDHVPGGVA